MGKSLGTSVDATQILGNQYLAVQGRHVIQPSVNHHHDAYVPLHGEHVVTLDWLPHSPNSSDGRRIRKGVPSTASLASPYSIHRVYVRRCMQ